MKRIALVASVLAALAALLLRRRSPVARPRSAGDPRAQALRERLAERRRQGQAARAGGADVDLPPEEDVDERRRRVHEEGRAAADRMRGPCATDREDERPAV